jgi:O-antigen ligase
MSTVLDTRQIRTSAVVVAGASVAAAVFLYAASSESPKVVGGIVGAVICSLAALASGNVRLFALWGLMFALPFNLSKHFGPLYEKMGGEVGFRIEMSDPFVFVLAFYLVRDIYNNRRTGLQVPKVTYVWMLIMAMGAVTFLMGQFRLTAAHEVVRMFKLMILFLVLVNELDRPQRVLHCAGGLALAVTLQSMVGLIQYATQKQFGLDLLGETNVGTLDQLAADSIKSEKAFRVGAFLMHPNVFGAFLAALLPLFIGLFLLKTTKGYRLFFLMTMSLGVPALILTLSRSGWVSFAASCFVLMVLMLSHKDLFRRSLLAGGIAFAALGVVALFFAGPIVRRVFESKQTAVMGRFEYIETAVAMIKVKPLLGWGLNSYAWTAPPYTKYGARDALKGYQNWIPPVHNIYLLWFAETGIVGLLLHLSVLGWILWTAIRNLRVRGEFLFTVNAACLAGLIALLVDGMFSFTLRFNNVLRVFWVLSALIFAIHYRRLRDLRTAAGLPVRAGHLDGSVV